MKTKDETRNRNKVSIRFVEEPPHWTVVTLGRLMQDGNPVVISTHLTSAAAIKKARRLERV